MKDPLSDKPPLNASDSWTNSCKKIKTPQEAFRGRTAFPRFQRSSRESKHRSEQPRRSPNSIPLPGEGRTLKIGEGNVV